MILTLFGHPILDGLVLRAREFPSQPRNPHHGNTNMQRPCPACFAALSFPRRIQATPDNSTRLATASLRLCPRSQRFRGVIPHRKITRYRERMQSILSSVLEHLDGSLASRHQGQGAHAHAAQGHVHTRLHRFSYNYRARTEAGTISSLEVVHDERNICAVARHEP